MTDNALKSKAFKLKGRLYTLTVLHILHADNEQLSQQLLEVVTQAPLLFENSPIVLDVSALAGVRFELMQLIDSVRRYGLLPIAIQGGTSAINQSAQALGLALLHASTNLDKALNELPSEAVVLPTLGEIKTKLITLPVRSGQQIVSKAADLIITSTVSRGAEVLSEGNIHVYGTLRGKALAGISGDRNARIFCRVLDAELVAIAGIYQLREGSPPPSGPCQIFIQDDRIKIDPL